MNENEVHIPETPADQPDAFLSGWDDEIPALDVTADQPEDGTEKQAQDAGEGQTSPMDAADGVDNADGQNAGAMPPEANAGQQQETPAGQDSAAAEESPAADVKPQSWTVKHMDTERTLTSADITPELLQKGLDYDRVRGKYDEAKPVIEVLGELARRSGMDLNTYARSIRAEIKKAQGMSEAEATRAVELEDREAAISAKEAEAKKATEAKAAADSKISNDLTEFGRAFPQVYEQAKNDPKTIPQTVWEDVRHGLSLTAAYSRYAVAQAEMKAADAVQRAATEVSNAKNAARSTGSMASAGTDGKNRDPFLEGWDS